MKFKVIIEGRTKQELNDNIREYLGLDKEPHPAQPPEQADFLTNAAKLPDVPKTSAPEPRREIPLSSTAPAPSHVVSATPSPTPTGGNDYGVDSRGLPWDERIHSVTQSKNKDGSWRNRRGVEDVQIRTVEAELATKARGMQEAQMVPAPHPVSIVPPHIPQPMAATIAPPAAPPVPTPAPLAVAPPIPIPPPVALVPAAHSLKTFKETLIPTLAKLVKDGKLTQEYINILQTHFGVQELWRVNDQQLEELFNNFVQYGMVVKAE